MKISLIIAFYKNIDALSLILKALLRQRYNDFEVIVAEDDNHPATVQFLAEASPRMPFVIKHVHQEKDDGFRKNQMLNEAIRQSAGDFLVFLDGDCIPHRNFLKAYARFAELGLALFARRVMLSEDLTQKLYQTQDLSHLSPLSLWRSRSRYKKYSLYLPFYKQQYKLGIFGCNWGIYKDDILAVNGFDEDYVTAGVGEDNDIEWRLVAKGMRVKSIRYAAIEYHLHHSFNYADKDTAVGYRLMAEKKEQGAIRCKNGLVKGG